MTVDVAVHADGSPDTGVPTASFRGVSTGRIEPAGTRLTTSTVAVDASATSNVFTCDACGDRMPVTNCCVMNALDVVVVGVVVVLWQAHVVTSIAIRGTASLIFDPMIWRSDAEQA